jgi:hypothetical protein
MSEEENAGIMQEEILDSASRQCGSSQDLRLEKIASQ